jgi:5-methylcytosine-specific restriction endonuclease McrA
MNCFYCGCKLEQIYFPGDGRGMVGNWVRDHQMPCSRGGSNAHSNLVDCCMPCNSRKGTKTVEEYRSWLEIRRLKQGGLITFPISPLPKVVFYGEV